MPALISRAVAASLLLLTPPLRALAQDVGSTLDIELAPVEFLTVDDAAPIFTPRWINDGSKIVNTDSEQTALKTQLDAELQRQFNDERPVVLDIWASWCGHCIAGFPDLDKFARTHPGVFVAAIAPDNQRDTFEKIYSKITDKLPELAQAAANNQPKIHFGFGFGPASSDYYERMRVNALPTSILIIKKKIVWIGVTSHLIENYDHLSSPEYALSEEKTLNKEQHHLTAKDIDRQPKWPLKLNDAFCQERWTDVIELADKVLKIRQEQAVNPWPDAAKLSDAILGRQDAALLKDRAARISAAAKKFNENPQLAAKLTRSAKDVLDWEQSSVVHTHRFKAGLKLAESKEGTLDAAMEYGQEAALMAIWTSSNPKLLYCLSNAVAKSPVARAGDLAIAEGWALEANRIIRENSRYQEEAEDAATALSTITRRRMSAQNPGPIASGRVAIPSADKIKFD